MRFRLFCRIVMMILLAASPFATAARPAVVTGTVATMDCAPAGGAATVPLTCPDCCMLVAEAPAAAAPQRTMAVAYVAAADTLRGVDPATARRPPRAG